MRRYRRLVLIDRVIPFLAAFVGLLALAGAVLVQVNADAEARRLNTELAQMRLSLDLVTQRSAALTGPVDDGTAEGLLALQDRMVKLEADMATQTASVTAAQQAPAALASADGSAAPAEVNPDLPTTDCIPLGTRFMVTPNESYSLCQSTETVRVSGITGDTVTIEGAGTVPETGFAKLSGGSCTVMVFTADVEGFAELRVTCT